VDGVQGGGTGRVERVGPGFQAQGPGHQTGRQTYGPGVPGGGEASRADLAAQASLEVPPQDLPGQRRGALGGQRDGGHDQPRSTQVRFDGILQGLAGGLQGHQEERIQVAQDVQVQAQAPGREGRVLYETAPQREDPVGAWSAAQGAGRR